MKRLLYLLPLLVACTKSELAPVTPASHLIAPVVTSITTTVTKTSTVYIPNYGTCNMVTYTPAGATSKLPVLVFTPGNGEVGTNPDDLYYHGPLKFIKTGWRPNFIIVGIQPRFGCDSRSKTFCHAMLTEIRKNPLVDTNQVYLTGLSGGAYTTLHYLRDHPSPYKVKAILVFSINMSKICATTLCGGDIRFKTIPAWGMCGDADDLGFTASMQAYFKNLTSNGCPARFNLYSGGHGGWDTFYNPTWTTGGLSVYDWLLKQGQSATVAAAATYKHIPVNLTDLAHSYSGWNSMTGLSDTSLKYTNGTASTVKATLSSSVATKDNGSTYGSGMAPAEVLRFVSYSIQPRTLTLSGLSPAKTYNLYLYASRAINSAEVTKATIGTTTKSVSTYKNLTGSINFSSLVPDSSGAIVVKLSSGVTYNYLNGFSLTEITK
jgi:hypothetical protein